MPRFCWLIAMVLMLSNLRPLLASNPAEIDFNRDIRPILSESCYQCHGPDVKQRKANLRLDQKAGLFQTADGTTIVTPGKPDDSELLTRIKSSDDGTRMPPPGRKPLTPTQVELVRDWISQGAVWKGHWAYVPPTQPALPTLAQDSTNPLDLFIRDRLREQQLDPAPEADRATLIRRLSLDLLGLPPSPEDVASFVADKDPRAYERLVDRLLASPRFGERMAIFWLDLVRFADTTGYHSDNHVDIYLYRDYVIRSFNRNIPFDRFTIEQLAGDLLPDANDETRIASGYNRLLQTTQEGGAQAKEYIAKYAADRVRNLSSVWLGSTMGCAECHDHKYDPFSTREFYSLAAFFADIQETSVGVQQPTLFPNPDQARELARVDAEMAKLKAIEKPGETEVKRLAELVHRQKELTRGIPSSLVSISGDPRVVRVLPRGNWLDETGPVVTPAVPAFLASTTTTTPAKGKSRLDLARWLVSGSNPLVARVMVNRFWKLAFGQGLVATADDFGSQGTWPTHPHLLDWLACEFRNSGWDIKSMLKLIVTSQTYCQSSIATPHDRQQDPANLWLARQNAIRLDSELIRDNALAISGLLSDKIGGPSVKPYQPAGYWVFLNFPARDYVPEKGPNQYRRGLYTYWQRTFVHPSLLAFDASTREECVVQRARSNTPLQALVLLNDPTYVEAARALAIRLIKSPAKTAEDRLGLAYRLAVARPPRTQESQLLLHLLGEHYRQYRADLTGARELAHIGDSPTPVDIDPAELAAWISVTRAILNLHETITRN